MLPDRGRVLSSGRISWQIGFAGSFHPDLTGAQNTRFIARIYGVDTRSLAHAVQSFAELGDSFHLPFRNYSSGMKARFAFGVSMAIPFTYYLIDEVTSVGDASFKAKCADVLRSRLSTAGAVVVSHSDSTLRSLCTAGAVLEDGILTYYEDVEDAITHHTRNMNASIAAGTASSLTTQKESAEGPSPTEIYLEGRQDLEEARFDEAVEKILAAVRARPEVHGWRAGLAVAYLRAGQPDEAVAQYMEAVRLDARNVRYLLALAGLLAKQGRMEESVNSYLGVIGIDSSSTAAWHGLGHAYATIGDYNAAVRAFKMAIQSDPAHLASKRSLTAIISAGAVSSSDPSGGSPGT